MTRYCMTMTESQARLVIRALDFFSRMRMGQFTELIDLVLPVKGVDIDDYVARREEAVRILLNARDVLMPDLRDMHSLHGSYSVYMFDDARAAWHTLQAIRSCIAWHNNPAGGVTVDFDRPSGDAPKCEAIDERGDDNARQTTTDTSAD